MLEDWKRVLKPGGKLIYTDAMVRDAGAEACKGERTGMNAREGKAGAGEDARG